MKNLLLTFLVFLIALGFGCGEVFAGGTNEPVDTNQLGSLVGVFERILSYAMGVSGAVLVIMIAYGVWKSSMALGDPRGLEGAKQTWTYAIFGFFVVVGVFVIFAIISGIFGISIDPLGLFGGIRSALESLTGLPQTHRIN